MSRQANRCPHGFVDRGRNPDYLCPECSPVGYLADRQQDTALARALRSRAAELEPAVGAGRLAAGVRRVLEHLGRGPCREVTQDLGGGREIRESLRAAIRAGWVTTRERGRTWAIWELTAAGLEALERDRAA